MKTTKGEKRLKTFARLKHPRLCPRYIVISLCCCCSVTELCPTLCDSVDCSAPGFPVLNYLLELAPGRWDSPGKKTRDLLHRVSHKFIATRVCLAWQGPQTRLPGPPPPPDPRHQTKQARGYRPVPFALNRYGRCPLFLCVEAMSIGLGTKPGHQEADVEGRAWARLSEHPCSLVLLGVSGLSVDEEGKAGRPPFDLSSPLFLPPLLLPSSSLPPALPPPLHPCL